MVAYVGLDVNGMIGSILQVAVLVVIPYTILGQVLARTGGADFFSDLAMSAMWRFRGGAAKIAVVGSALFGMISGSAVSNVLAVGIVTIPAMIKSGFSPYAPPRSKSVGSTGGQLMPPVMGAAAFIMAEFLQVSYGAVCIAAAIPAVLYYACLFIHVDLEAAKQGIGGVEDESMPSLAEVLKSGWHFLVPIVFLVIALIYPEVLLLTPEKAAVAATAILIVFALIFGYRGKRASLKQIAVAVIESGRVSLDIILIGAAAGIMVGIMSISGLAFGMTMQLLALSGDNVFLLLLLIAVLAFVLGIGLPTVSVYILTATLLAPALVKLGVTPMAAHMFVMYNGMLSMITPPVAFAAYAAANIAKHRRLDHRLDRLPGRLEHVHPAVPVRADAEPADGRPELPDRLELRAHPVRAVRRHRRHRRLCADAAVAAMRACLRLRGAADRAAAGELHRRLRHQLHRHRRRHRAAGVRSLRRKRIAASRRDRRLRALALKQNAPPFGGALAIQHRGSKRRLTSSRARCRALPAPACRRSRTAPPRPSRRARSCARAAPRTRRSGPTPAPCRRPWSSPGLRRRRRSCRRSTGSPCP